MIDFEFAFKFELMPIDCFFETNYHIGLAMYTLVPFGVYALLFIITWAAPLCTGGRMRIDGLGWCLWIAFLIYPAVTGRIFGTFICEPLDDGRNVLKADMQIDCESPNHKTAMFGAGLMIFVRSLIDSHAARATSSSIHTYTPQTMSRPPSHIIHQVHTLGTPLFYMKLYVRQHHAWPRVHNHPHPRIPPLFHPAGPSPSS